MKSTTGRTEPRPVSFRCTRIHRRSRCHRYLAHAEAVRILGLEKKTKIYLASTSELYGLCSRKFPKGNHPVLSPFTLRWPNNTASGLPRTTAKATACLPLTASCLTTRANAAGETFVTRKITLVAARTAQGFQDKLYRVTPMPCATGGYAKDYVECMWLILQHDVPGRFCDCHGRTTTPFAEFATLAFKEVGITLRWEGKGVDEKGLIPPPAECW